MQPCRHVKITGATGSRIRHDDAAFVFRLEQIFPAFRFFQAKSGRFHSVEAQSGSPDIHTDPCGWVGTVNIAFTEFADIFRRVVLQHAFFVQNQQRAGCHTHHHIGLRSGFFCQQLGRDDAGGIAHPFDFDIRIFFFELRLICLELVGFQCGVHGERGISDGIRRLQRQQGGATEDKVSQSHGSFLVRLNRQQKNC